MAHDPSDPDPLRARLGVAKRPRRERTGLDRPCEIELDRRRESPDERGVHPLHAQRQLDRRRPTTPCGQDPAPREDHHGGDERRERRHPNRPGEADRRIDQRERRDERAGRRRDAADRRRDAERPDSPRRRHEGAGQARPRRLRRARPSARRVGGGGCVTAGLCVVDRHAVSVTSRRGRRAASNARPVSGSGARSTRRPGEEGGERARRGGPRPSRPRSRR